MRARRIRIVRFCRAMLLPCAAFDFASTGLRMTVWYSPGDAVYFAAVAFFTCGVIAYQTKVLHFLGWRRVLGVADLPGVMWILLAGRSERARLRKAVARRRQPLSTGFSGYHLQ